MVRIVQQFLAIAISLANKILKQSPTGCRGLIQPRGSFFKPKIERKSYWIIFCSILELNNELNSDFLPFHLILDVAVCLQHLNYVNPYSKPKNDNFII